MFFSPFVLHFSFTPHFFHSLKKYDKVSNMKYQQITQFSLSVQVWGSSRRLHLSVWWPLSEGLSWRGVHGEWKHWGWRHLKRPSEVSRKISLATLWPFRLLMTNCSSQKFLVSCLSLDCQKRLLTYLYPHAVVIIYLFTWNGYWGVEIVMLLAMTPPYPQSFADSDHL